MKKVIKSRIAKILLVFSMFAVAALPVLAKTTSDGNNAVNSSMNPAAVIGGVALIIGLVVGLAAKGSSRVPVQK